MEPMTKQEAVTIIIVLTIQTIVLLYPTFRTFRVRSFMFSKTASNWFRKLLNLNAEAQRTLSTAEDL